eukprot:CAMPEP_0206517018 /NCGR_PEP_ID=MMETSP0324_2-20121206/63710_1 /ASSEMBLY_ACC=CAM_ASM_000836 /TAXON_ID=2866 /ORGANISM="Crypthecodinium cohnii, Strain Seligo" /LENGTH=917 /DNA_ID=CAMNT_0054010057 /DNA_START=27 /DNA_END=2780 /DNA_ORIENTATION=+
MSDSTESPCESGCRVHLLRAFDSKWQYSFASVKDQYDSREEYYQTMCTNTLAEAVAAFQINPRTRLQLRNLDEAWLEVRAEMNSDADLNVQDNILEYEGRLYWVTSVKEDPKTKTTRIRGFGLNGRRLQMERSGWQQVRVCMYAGDYLGRYRASYNLQRSPAPVPALEEAVLAPGRQALGQYPACRDLRTEVLMVNTRQEKAVRHLKNRVEVIHGPPGTGKSTTIFHILASKLLKNTVAVVTCVTNQAIDAVAEKLEIGHNLPDGEAIRMLVLGNPKRVGATAGKYTLPELVKRDPLVLAMRHAIQVIEETKAAVNDLQWARVDCLVRDHQHSRLSEAVLLEEFPSLQEALEDNFGSTVTECHLKVVNSVKRRMMTAFVRSRKMKLKLVNDEAQGAWDVSAFQERLRVAGQRAFEGLSLMESTASERVIRGTQVVLCTISSAHKVAKLRNDYESFPDKTFLGILDEAAATPETYVPMLVDMGIQHLVMLGDHKQLSPLVVTLGGSDEIDGQNVDRSFMERALAAGVKQHSLTEQYRMPRTLCDLVSWLFYQENPLSTGKNKPQQSSKRELRWIRVEQEEDSIGSSKVNIGEVLEIHRLLSTDAVLSRPESRIMIIALYKPQAALLKMMVEKFFPKRPVQVVTVDAAQGSEEQHLVLSTVRCNQEGDIGFSKNPRRICVALSRAQETLTIVGSIRTFSARGWMWRSVQEHFSKYGTISQSKLGYSTTLRNFVDGAVEGLKAGHLQNPAADRSSKDQDSDEAVKLMTDFAPKTPDVAVVVEGNWPILPTSRKPLKTEQWLALSSSDVQKKQQEQQQQQQQQEQQQQQPLPPTPNKALKKPEWPKLLIAAHSPETSKLPKLPTSDKVPTRPGRVQTSADIRPMPTPSTALNVVMKTKSNLSQRELKAARRAPPSMTKMEK